MANSSLSADIMLSDQQRLIFQWVFYSVVCELIVIFGTVANIINIICFVKQGRKDAVNISLLGLAFSDLGSLIPLMWTNICFSPAFSDLDLPFEPMEIQYLTGSGPHVTFTRVTGWITAFITLERCLCITKPLKVKSFFTPKRVWTAMVLIFMMAVLNAAPIYCVNNFGETFSTLRNKTVIGLIFRENTEIIKTVVFVVSACVSQISAFIVVVICTVVLVVNLRSKTKWRQMSVVNCKNEKGLIRDQKVTKMVTVISIFFIVCFMPVCLSMIAMLVEPEFSLEGKYINLFISVFSICFFLESTNSAMNIIIYYNMSSKYRNALRQLFTRRVS